jgi:hypothetical protein
LSARQAEVLNSLIKIIEEFFGASFHKGQEIWEITTFDGYAHWHLLLFPKQRLLKITADRDPTFSAFPTLEIEGFYSDEVSTSPVAGVGVALMLRLSEENMIVITKTEEGRLSLCMGIAGSGSKRR